MATQPLSLLLFIIFSLSSLSTITPIAVNPYTQTRPNLSGSSTSSYIRVSCRATSYPSLCYQTLSRYSNIIGTNPRKLATIALAVSLSRTKTTLAYISKLSKTRGIGKLELQVIKDCVEMMEDSVDELSESIKELSLTKNGRDFKWHMGNVQTWVSGVLTNADTCVDGFVKDGARFQGVISMRVNNLERVTTNALALVNRFASTHI